MTKSLHESQEYLMKDVYSRENIEKQDQFETTDKPVTDDGLECKTKMFQARLPYNLYKDMSDLEVIEHLYQNVILPDIRQYEERQRIVAFRTKYMAMEDPYVPIEEDEKKKVFLKALFRYAAE